MKRNYSETTGGGWGRERERESLRNLRERPRLAEPSFSYP